MARVERSTWGSRRRSLPHFPPLCATSRHSSARQGHVNGRFARFFGSSVSGVSGAAAEPATHLGAWCWPAEPLEVLTGTSHASGSQGCHLADGRNTRPGGSSMRVPCVARAANPGRGCHDPDYHHAARYPSRGSGGSDLYLAPPDGIDGTPRTRSWRRRSAGRKTIPARDVSSWAVASARGRRRGGRRSRTAGSRRRGCLRGSRSSCRCSRCCCPSG